MSPLKLPTIISSECPTLTSYSHEHLDHRIEKSFQLMVFIELNVLNPPRILSHVVLLPLLVMLYALASNINDFTSRYKLT